MKRFRLIVTTIIGVAFTVWGMTWIREFPLLRQDCIYTGDSSYAPGFVFFATLVAAGYAAWQSAEGVARLIFECLPLVFRSLLTLAIDSIKGWVYSLSSAFREVPASFS